MPYKIYNRRYTGSKYKLKDWIVGLIQEYCEGQSFCDIFAGTGIMGLEMIDKYNTVIFNDLLYSNNIIYRAFFEQSNYNEDKLLDYKKMFNAISFENKSNYASENYGGKFFSINDAYIIGEIRQIIEDQKESLTEKEYCILLASLVYSVDKISNTVGHYDAYRKKEKLGNRFCFELIDPVKTTSKVEIYREDANIIANDIKADVVYLDPPYNSRQYSRFYHLLENLITWQKPKLFGEALKPAPENMSEYCRVNAPLVFEELIKILQCKYIVVSYNNTYNSKSSSSKNKIALEQIRETLARRGKVLEFSKQHQFFNAGKTSFADHKEFIFILKIEGGNK